MQESGSILKKIKHIILGWFYYIKGYDFEVFTERMNICDVCEFREELTKKHSICSKCGCFLQAKLRVKDEKCPENKW